MNDNYDPREEMLAWRASNMKARDAEHRLQVSCVKWFRLRYPKLWMNLFAVANGGRRDAITGSRLKSEGVVAGVSDLILLVRRGTCGALCIEMKTEDGRQRTTQREWQRAVEAEGYQYAIVRTLSDFIKLINDYIGRE